VTRPVAVSILAPVALLVGQSPDYDPFEFFRPTIAVTPPERRELAGGDPLVRVLPGSSRETGVFAAVSIDVDGDRLVAWTRRISELKKSGYVLAIGRFSDPPAIDDLSTLTLDDEDMSAIRRCRPGDCGLKLSSLEMARLQRTAGEAGTEWRPALQLEFRRMVLERVEAYLAGGHAALEDYHDKEDPRAPGPEFAELLPQVSFLGERLPQLADYLERFPHRPMPGVESFVYWSTERLGGKPTISATHVSILRGDDSSEPDAMVVGKGIFSTHYVNASLAVTALVRPAAAEPGYLVYLNRSAVDLVGGPFGGLVRIFVERRLRSEARAALAGLRQRLESGPPPAAPAPQGSDERR
jgi:hypothetical protein